MKKITVVVALLVVMASSCKKDEMKTPVSTTTEQSFSHLKVGNQWVYDFAYDGNVLDSLTTQVVSESNNVFAIKTFDNSYAETNFQFIDGIHLKQFKKGQQKSEATILNVFNAKQGETWSIKGENGEDSIVYKVTDINTTITVPAGKFTCTKTEALFANGSQLIIYTTPKYSAVKMELRTGVGSPIVAYSLRTVNF